MFHRAKDRPLSGLAAGMIVALLFTFPAAAATVYEIDPVHTDVIFRVSHLGVSHAYGRFNDISGLITLDDAEPSLSSIRFEIRAETIDTNDEKRDKHLRSPDFFNVKQFPTISFVSSSVKKNKAGDWEVAGELSLHGVSKPVTVEVRKVGEGKDPWGGYRAGFTTEFTVKRSDFGMKFMLEGVGDEVHIIVAVECVRK